MASQYLVQIVDKKTRQVVNSWQPGLQAELEFEAELLRRVQKMGVGVFRTEAHVLKDVQAAIRELLYELKSRV